MSNNPHEFNSYVNENYSNRQQASSFQPPFEVPNYSSPPEIFYPSQPPFYQPQGIPPLTMNLHMQSMPPYYPAYPSDPQQQFGNQYFQQAYMTQSTGIPQSVMNSSPTTITSKSLSADAPSFSPGSNNTNTIETKPPVVPTPTPPPPPPPPSSSTNDSETKTVTSKIPILISTNTSETKSTDSFTYDLEKYKHEYFISSLSGNFDPNYRKFGSPTGICALNDDRLLVANYDRDSLVLIDLNGVTYQLYRDLPAPKDVRLYTKNTTQAVVATKKEVVILDLETSKVVVRSKIRGFYPWNVQYLSEPNIIAACDPSGERILYLDKDLNEFGDWSFHEQTSQSASSQGYQKIYPYAAHFLSDNTSFVITHRNDKCQLEERDVASGMRIKIWDGPARLQAYSVYVDSARKCLIPDKANHSLISVHDCSTINTYKFKNIYEPYSLTFLSNGTLCVTDWNKSFGTNGGVAILSETNLKSSQ